MLYMVLKALHVLGVLVWVGGMAFAHFFLRPAAAALEPAQRLPLLAEVMRRFLGAVGVAVLVILASGVWMIGRVAKQVVQGGGQFNLPPDWLLMTVVGLFMMALYGHIRFVLYKRLAAAVQRQEWPQAAAAMGSVRTWVLVNLVLGLLLIVAVYLL